MTVIRREILESPFEQGVDEIVAYDLTTTPWGGTPTSPVVVVKDMTAAAQDVTTTVMPTNSPTIVGDVITLSPLKLLTLDHNYRLEIRFTTGTNTFEAFARIKATL